MIGGGEFIINGAERVVVSQLHRSPGRRLRRRDATADKELHSCRIIPERGSWIEINVTKKDTLGVRIDQCGKFSAMTLLRAMDPAYTSDRRHPPAVLRAETVKLKIADGPRKLVGDPEQDVPPMIAVDDVIDPETGEVYLDAGEPFTDDSVDKIIAVERQGGRASWRTPKDPLILNVARRGRRPTAHEEALLKIYQRLRPGNPPQLEKAKELFQEKFHDANRYRLGRVGRFRINRKFDQNVPEDGDDAAGDGLRQRRSSTCSSCGPAKGHVDDIDHLGNRRLRTIDELAADELRKGFLKLRRTVQERMAIRDQQDMTPRTLINPKSISAAIEYFFGRGELSQVVDQTNPLSQLTHERRLSALGPGGLNRKRAGFEVRDVHISHYGRICPIETPEGTNIGLISSPVDLRRGRRVRLPDHAVPQGQEQAS